MNSLLANRTSTSGAPHRQAKSRHYVMCAPTYFSVEYRINPWMAEGTTVNVDLAMAQWQSLVHTYRSLGHTVDLLDPDPTLPDMVFAANGGIVRGGRAFPATFAYPQRAAEADHHRAWFSRSGLELAAGSEFANEGEGDFLVVGERVLAGTGFRTREPSHHQLRQFLGCEVVTLKLVDPRFYHLDVALAVLSDDVIAFYPGAFDPRSVATLRDMFPTAIEVPLAEAESFALNAVSDGHNVVHDASATTFPSQLIEAGFRSIPRQMTELRKAGGSVKCCTLELY